MHGTGAEDSTFGGRLVEDALTENGEFGDGVEGCCDVARDLSRQSHNSFLRAGPDVVRPEGSGIWTSESMVSDANWFDHRMRRWDVTLFVAEQNGLNAASIGLPQSGQRAGEILRSTSFISEITSH